MLFMLLYMNTSAQYYLKKDYIELQKQDETLYGITFKNLKIVPLFAGASFVAANNDVGKFRTLKEVLEAGQVEIKETGAVQQNQSGGIPNRQLNQSDMNAGNSGDVNHLMIRNLTQDTVFIMAGELVQGGKQDRVVGENFLLPPGKDFVPLPVFCVEHGRWTYNNSDKSGFKKYNSFTANSVRSKAVQSKDQSQVWSQVSEITTANKSSTSTGTFNAIFENEAFSKEYDEYKEYFLAELGKINGCIGFAGISGGRVVGCDIFATEDLFRQQSVSLLSAYITEAITENKAPSLSDREIQDYLLSFLTESVRQDQDINEKGRAFENAGKKLHIATF